VFRHRSVRIADRSASLAPGETGVAKTTCQSGDHQIRAVTPVPQENWLLTVTVEDRPA
jgi:hypothetical protein